MRSSTQLEIAGAWYRKLKRGEVNVGDEVGFVKDDGNKHHDKAVAICVKCLNIGFLPRGIAEECYDAVDELNEYCATISQISYEDDHIQSITIMIEGEQ